MCCVYIWFFFFFKQKTAYEMRISDWSSDVCSSDLIWRRARRSTFRKEPHATRGPRYGLKFRSRTGANLMACSSIQATMPRCSWFPFKATTACRACSGTKPRSSDSMQSKRRSEEHTSELQSLMRISYAVFCLKKKKIKKTKQQQQ